MTVRHFAVLNDVAAVGVDTSTVSAKAACHHNVAYGVAAVVDIDTAAVTIVDALIAAVLYTAVLDDCTVVDIHTCTLVGVAVAQGEAIVDGDGVHPAVIEGVELHHTVHVTTVEDSGVGREVAL